MLQIFTTLLADTLARYFTENQKDKLHFQFLFGLVLGQISKGLLLIMSQIIKINKLQ